MFFDIAREAVIDAPVFYDQVRLIKRTLAASRSSLRCTRTTVMESSTAATSGITMALLERLPEPPEPPAAITGTRMFKNEIEGGLVPGGVPVGVYRSFDRWAGPHSYACVTPRRAAGRAYAHMRCSSDTSHRTTLGPVPDLDPSVSFFGGSGWHGPNDRGIARARLNTWERMERRKRGLVPIGSHGGV